VFLILTAFPQMSSFFSDTRSCTRYPPKVLYETIYFNWQCIFHISYQISSPNFKGQLVGFCKTVSTFIFFVHEHQFNQLLA